MEKKEIRQRIRSTDVTDVTDVKDRRKKEEGRRKFGNGLAFFGCNGCNGCKG
ncbi:MULTISPECIES: hypothetical protein [unclassified Microcoleus]|uniref:hypothetical protein n=1 Tax=unclassified Microcoleus TaxID=2642155 RepID=UPI002FD58F91